MFSARTRALTARVESTPPGFHSIFCISMSLFSLGWDAARAAQFQLFAQDGLVPARVAQEHKHAFELLAEDGPVGARCAGRLRHLASARAELPAVGDWVAIQRNPADPVASIHAVLPRRTVFVRQSAGSLAEAQVVAANVDTVLLVTGLDQNFNLRRIERTLLMARDSGAQPVVVLNKTDLHADPEQAAADAGGVAMGAPVVALSATDGCGLEALEPWLIPGHTLALLGSSGVGKSTLINRLLGVDRQATSDVSDAVGKGRHTTTRRELILAPSGVMIIDTPGMREFQLWDPGEEALDSTFSDIAQLASSCRFDDCTHDLEPGCAVRAALDDGTLDAGRWQGFQKLRREHAYAARRDDPRLARETKNHWKKVHRGMRAAQRMKEFDD